MRRPRALLAGLVAAVLATGGLAVATADTTPTTAAVTFGAETWYDANPTCKIPAEGCLPVPLPAVNPYGAGTLHVAETAGMETDRAYLAMNTPADYQDISGGTLTIPLDTSTTAGSVNPDTAKIAVCLDLVGDITAKEGEFDAPPATDCSGGVELTYSATPAPELTADLAPLATSLQEYFAFGSLAIGLVPDDPSTTATWHAAFASDDAASPATPPASLTLTFGAAGAAATPSDSPSAPAATGPPVTTQTPVLTAPRPARSAADAAAAPASATRAAASAGPPAASIPETHPAASAASAAAPEVAGESAEPAPAPAQEAQTPTAFAHTVTVGFAYPGLLLLPLVLLLLGFALARVMTRPMTAPRR